MSPLQEPSSLEWLEPISAGLSAVMSTLWKSFTNKAWPLVSDGLALVVLTVFTILVGRWLLKQFVGRRRFEVVPVEAPGIKGLPEHSAALIGSVHEMMRRQVELMPGMVQSAAFGAKAPMMVYPGGTASASVARALSVRKEGELMAVLVRLITQPQFRITGSVYQSGQVVDVVIRVERYGKHLSLFDKRCGPAAIVDTIKDLGFLALKSIAIRG